MLLRSRRLVLAAAMMCASCTFPFNDESGMAVPKDPGTVVVSVRDAAGVRLEGVRVQVHDIPNNVGTFYSVGAWTDSAGSRSLHGIPAGPRRVEVTPPAGFTAGPDGATKPVQVVKGNAVTVTFTLTRQ
jgi:hypothetical protein